MTSPPISAAVTDLVAGVGSGGGRICFNTHCKEPKSEGFSTRRKGWRLRSGELADLCDCCSYVLVFQFFFFSCSVFSLFFYIFTESYLLEFSSIIRYLVEAAEIGNGFLV